MLKRCYEACVRAFYKKEFVGADKKGNQYYR